MTLGRRSTIIGGALLLARGGGAAWAREEGHSGVLRAGAHAGGRRDAPPEDAPRLLQRVVIGCGGGSYASALQAIAGSALSLRNIRLVVDIADPLPRIDSIRLARAYGQPPSCDVVVLDDIAMYALSLSQPFRPATPQYLTRLTGVVPELRLPYAVPQMQSGLVIAYRASLAGPVAPESYAALAGPRFRGRIGFSDAQFLQVMGAASLAADGDMSNYAPGLAWLRHLRRLGARSYPSDEALGNALRTGEVWAALTWRAHAAVWQRDLADLCHHEAEEGAIPVIMQAGMLLESADPRAAVQACDTLLSPQVQKEFMIRTGFLPTVLDLLEDHDTIRTYGFSTYQRDRFQAPDYAYLAREMPRLWEQWTAIFGAGPPRPRRAPAHPPAKPPPARGKPPVKL